MEPKHYPGPWKIGRRKPHVQTFDTDDHWEFAKVVCRVSGNSFDIPEAAANVRLISKAPEMRAMLVELIEEFGMRGGKDDKLLIPELQLDEIAAAMMLVNYIDKGER